MLKIRLAETIMGVCLLLLCWTGAGAAEVVDRVVAIVNDEVITMSELELMAKSLEGMTGLSRNFKSDKNLQRQMLEALIDQKLAKAEAKRRGISVAQKELDQAVADFRRQNRLEDDKAFNEALGKAGLTVNELKQKILDQIVHERLMQLQVGAKVTVSDAELRRFYETQFPKEGGIRLHLKILSMPFPAGATTAQKEEVQKKAETALNEFKQGAALEEIGRKYEFSLQDLGFISEGDLDPKLAQFLRNLKPKEVGPIQTSEGFQLVQLVARKSGGETRSYDEAAPQIRSHLMRQEMAKRFSEWARGLRDKAAVKIML